MDARRTAGIGGKSVTEATGVGGADEPSDAALCAAIRVDSARAIDSESLENADIPMIELTLLSTVMRATG